MDRVALAVGELVPFSAGWGGTCPQYPLVPMPMTHTPHTPPHTHTTHTHHTHHHTHTTHRHTHHIYTHLWTCIQTL